MNEYLCTCTVHAEFNEHRVPKINNHRVSTSRKDLYYKSLEHDDKMIACNYAGNSAAFLTSFSPMIIIDAFVFARQF